MQLPYIAVGLMFAHSRAPQDGDNMNAPGLLGFLVARNERFRLKLRVSNQSCIWAAGLERALRQNAGPRSTNRPGRAIRHKFRPVSIICAVQHVFAKTRSCGPTKVVPAPTQYRARRRFASRALLVDL